MMISEKSVYWLSLRNSRSEAHSSCKLTLLSPLAFSLRLSLSWSILTPSKPSILAPCSLAFRSGKAERVNCEVEDSLTRIFFEDILLGHVHRFVYWLVHAQACVRVEHQLHGV